jgi:hypothetical protein
MSIDKIRQLVEGRGCCGILTTGAMIIAAGMFIFQSNCTRTAPGQNPDAQQNVPVVAKVNGVSIPESVLKLNESAPPNPGEMAQAYGQGLYQAVTNALIAGIAAKEGVKVDEKGAVDAVVEGKKQGIKMELMRMGKVTFSSSDADVDAELQKLAHKSMANFEAEVRKQAQEDIADPSKKAEILSVTLAPTLFKAREAKVVVSDDEVKAQFKGKLPKDFDKRKDEYRKTLIQSKASEQLRKDLQAAQRSAVIEWNGNGFKALYEMMSTFQGGGTPDALKKVYAEAASPGVGELNKRVAALVRYSTFNMIYPSASPADKKKMDGEKIEMLQQLADTAPSVPILLELTNALKDAGKGSDAAQALIEASRTNSDMEAQGQSYYHTISTMETQLKAKGMLLAKDEEALNKSLADYKDELAQKLKYDADQRARDEADRKAAAADVAKRNASQKAAPAPTPASK